LSRGISGLAMAALSSHQLMAPANDTISDLLPAPSPEVTAGGTNGW